MVNPLIEQEISAQVEFIQRSLKVLEQSEIKIRPGAPPLDADNVAVVGNSIHRFLGDPDQGVGWSVVWGNGRRPTSGSYLINDNHSGPYFEFAAFIEALRATPRNESLTVISQAKYLKDYMTYKKVIMRGKCIVGEQLKVIKPLLAQLDDLLKDRPGVVDAITLEVNPAWLMQLKSSAKVIARLELQKLREPILKNMRSNTHRSNDVNNSRSRHMKKEKAQVRSRRSLPSRQDCYRTFSGNEPSSSSTRVIGESGTNRAPRAKASGLLGGNSRKRQAEDVVPTQVDARNKKQRTKFPASDTEDNDVYEDAAETFDQVGGASTLARSFGSTLINVFRHLFDN